MSAFGAGSLAPGFRRASHCPDARQRPRGAAAGVWEPRSRFPARLPPGPHAGTPRPVLPGSPPAGVLGALGLQQPAPPVPPAALKGKTQPASAGPELQSCLRRARLSVDSDSGTALWAQLSRGERRSLPRCAPPRSRLLPPLGLAQAGSKDRPQCPSKAVY